VNVNGQVQRRAVLGSAVVLSVAVGLFALVTRPASGAAGPQIDLVSERIHDAVDVTSAGATTPSGAAISVNRAIALAQAQFSATPRAVYLATGTQYPNSPERMVFVVIFDGGISPFDGPPEADASPTHYRVTGVILDATTGEFLRGFMQH